MLLDVKQAAVGTFFGRMLSDQFGRQSKIEVVESQHGGVRSVRRVRFAAVIVILRAWYETMRRFGQRRLP